jgi:hypothetical protein
MMKPWHTSTQRAWSQGKATPPIGSDQLAKGVVTPSGRAPTFLEEQCSTGHP